MVELITVSQLGTEEAKNDNPEIELESSSLPPGNDAQGVPATESKQDDVSRDPPDHQVESGGANDGPIKESQPKGEAVDSKIGTTAKEDGKRASNPSDSIPQAEEPPTAALSDASPPAAEQHQKIKDIELQAEASNAEGQTTDVKVEAAEPFAAALPDASPPAAEQFQQIKDTTLQAELSNADGQITDTTAKKAKQSPEDSSAAQDDSSGDEVKKPIAEQLTEKQSPSDESRKATIVENAGEEASNSKLSEPSVTPNAVVAKSESMPKPNAPSNDESLVSMQNNGEKYQDQNSTAESKDTGTQDRNVAVPSTESAPEDANALQNDMTVQKEENPMGTNQSTEEAEKKVKQIQVQADSEVPLPAEVSKQGDDLAGKEQPESAQPKQPIKADNNSTDRVATTITPDNAKLQEEVGSPELEAPAKTENPIPGDAGSPSAVQGLTLSEAAEGTQSNPIKNSEEPKKDPMDNAESEQIKTDEGNELPMDSMKEAVVISASTVVSEGTKEAALPPPESDLKPLVKPLIEQGKQSSDMQATSDKSQSDSAEKRSEASQILQLQEKTPMPPAEILKTQEPSLKEAEKEQIREANPPAEKTDEPLKIVRATEHNPIAQNAPGKTVDTGAVSGRSPQKHVSETLLLEYKNLSATLMYQVEGEVVKNVCKVRETTNVAVTDLVLPSEKSNLDQSVSVAKDNAVVVVPQNLPAVPPPPPEKPKADQNPPLANAQGLSGEGQKIPELKVAADMSVQDDKKVPLAAPKDNAEPNTKKEISVPNTQTSSIEEDSKTSQPPGSVEGELAQLHAKFAQTEKLLAEQKEQIESANKQSTIAKEEAAHVTEELKKQQAKAESNNSEIASLKERYEGQIQKMETYSSTKIRQEMSGEVDWKQKAMDAMQEVAQLKADMEIQFRQIRKEQELLRARQSETTVADPPASCACIIS